MGVMLISALLPASLYPEEGQYRSKILIDATGALEKGTALSIEQLEQQLDSLTDPYAKASVTRHLARQYIEHGEYEKAIAFYEAALEADGLSEIADREILRELARVHLLNEDYRSAAGALERVLQFNLAPAAGDYLLLAQAWFHAGDYVAAVAALDRLAELDLPFDVLQKRQVLALYYQAGAYTQCTKVLQELLEFTPDNPEYWHQSAAIYLLRDQKKEALDQLTLAWEKGVTFGERDILLLADLMAVNGQPYDAARVLQSAQEQKAIAESGENYRKQFEFWLQAQEKDRALAALTEAARRTGETELYLYLAQLHSENENWTAMQDTMMAACSSELEDKYVSRANLLLGVSQLKLGDNEAARRSFINATLIGGDSGQAAQWLRFMAAEPASKAEARRIVSPCYGSEDKRRRIKRTAGVDQADDTAVPRLEDKDGEASVVATKTIPTQSMFAVKYRMTAAEMAKKTGSLTIRLTVKLIQAGGEIDGPLHILLKTLPTAPGEAVDIQLALPSRGSPRSSGRYRKLRTEPFRCSYLLYGGAADGIPAAWAELAQTTLTAGYQLSGQARYVFSSADPAVPGAISVELQLGIE